jgi:hypothetical protein
LIVLAVIGAGYRSKAGRASDEDITVALRIEAAASAERSPI